jgi:hypothetical protein
VPRDELKEWVSAHETNKASLKRNYDYDVIFLGDEMVEMMNAQQPASNDDDAHIKQFFNKTFSKEANGFFDGLALGINGDSVSLCVCACVCWSRCS